MNLEKQQRKSYGIHTGFLLTLARGQSAMDLHLVSKLLSRNLGETEIGGTDLGMYLVMESVSGITTLKITTLLSQSGTGEATHDEKATEHGFKYNHLSICINPGRT